MPDQSLEIKTGGASYVGWRGQLLAELALARLPDLSVHRAREDCGYDFLVATPSGVCFFGTLEPEQILRAHGSHTPVFIFLIDADTGHGRHLRLDTLQVRSGRSQTVCFRREATIDKRGLGRLLAGLEQSERAASLR